MKEFRTKSIKAEIKDINESQRIVEGYLSIFDNVDSYDERVLKGAFTKTIKERGPGGNQRIRHFMDHNIYKSIGLFEELREDESGLYFRSKIGRHTLGNDALYMYMDGLIKEHSIGYDVIRDQKGADGIKELTELKLWEGSSLQSWAANELALVTDVKSLALIEQIEAMENVIRSSKMSDETIKLIELQLKVIRESLTPREAPEPKEDYSEVYQSLKLKL